MLSRRQDRQRQRQRSSAAAGRRLKVYVFRPTMGQGGADRVTITLLRELDRARFDVSLVLMRREGDLIDEVPGDIPIVDLAARDLWRSWKPLTALLRSQPPDVLVALCGGASMPAVVAHLASGRTCRLVLSERSIMWNGGVTGNRILQNLAKLVLYRFADHIACVSSGVKDDLHQWMRVGGDRVSVVYNPMLTPALEELAAEPVEDPWFAESEPPILAVGRLVVQKDFPTLLEAFAAVRHERPARLVILGEGPLRRELTEKAAALGISDAVKLPGFEKNPYRYMARCSLFVLSSSNEGLPGALIQAMACGAPAISTDCESGPREIIRESGVDGVLIPVGDKQALAQHMLALLDDPERRRAMGAAGKASARRFSVEESLPLYVAAITGEGA